MLTVPSAATPLAAGVAFPAKSVATPAATLTVTDSGAVVGSVPGAS